MISLYSGTPGSGKSLHAAEDIYNWSVFAKKPVIANFPIDRDILFYRTKKDKLKGKKRRCGKFYYFADEYLKPQLFYNFAKKFLKPKIEHQCLIIFDECSSDDLFNNRTWQNKGRDKWITFFRQHRKLGFDILFITQSDKLIDKAMRAFVEYEYKHRKGNNYKLFGKLLGALSGGAIFFSVQYWYGVREKVGVTMFRYKKRMGDLYDTFKVF